MEILQDFIPAGRPNRPGTPITPTSITVHETGNVKSGADALAHAKYIKSDAVGTTSWHYTVDDKRAVQHLPITERANHSGTAEGNNTSIGVEIAVNADGDRTAAEANAAELIASLLAEIGQPPTVVVQHNRWNGKDCPRGLRARPGGWEGFVAEVAMDMGQPAPQSGGTPILGIPQATIEQAQEWARSRGASDWFAGIVPLYWRLAPSHGSVRPEIAYAQSAKETGFGRFGGVIPGPEYHNPCGLKRTAGGSNDDPLAHGQFASDEEGVTAHLDHLALYAGAPGYPRANTPDPRHFASIAGKAPTVDALGGKWAPALNYGESIVRDYLAGLLATPTPVPEPAAPQPPSEVDQLRTRVAVLERELAASEVTNAQQNATITEQRAIIDGVRDLVARYR